MKFLEGQIYRGRKQISGSLGQGVEAGINYEHLWRNFLGDGNILDLRAIVMVPQFYKFIKMLELYVNYTSLELFFVFLRNTFITENSAKQKGAF